jgi:CheY-like chemotaxis protein
MENLDALLTTRPPSANRPLLGLTVLAVEDSRFACEALRLLSLRSGARIRRADNLLHARQHLKVYRPSVVIIDMGLPDGSGEDLIRDLAAATPRVQVLLGTSGDPEMEARMIAAGADGFLPKPIDSIAAFQTAILRHLPTDRQPPGPRSVSNELISPDMIAYRDDLAHVATVLSDADIGDDLDYVTQFLGGVARSAGDTELDIAVRRLAVNRGAGHPVQDDLVQITSLIQDRLSRASPL